jgi:short-subunit dehydrogenase
MSRRKGGSLWLMALGSAIGAASLTRYIRRKQVLDANPDFFKGKVVVITGGSRGLGRALAHALAGQQANLVLAARNEGLLRLVAGECEVIQPGIETLVVPTDVTDESQLERLIQSTVDRFGRVDVLVNNAGITHGGRFDETDFGDLRAVIAINLLAVMRLTQLALPVMLRQGSGQVINMCSVMGRHAFPYMATYCASKYGLIGFSDSMRRELMGTGIHVLTVNIGFMKTDMVSEEAQKLLRRYGVLPMNPDHVARRILVSAILGQPEVNIGGIEFATEWIAKFSPRLADYMWHQLAPADLRETLSRL